MSKEQKKKKRRWASFSKNLYLTRLNINKYKLKCQRERFAFFLVFPSFSTKKNLSALMLKGFFKCSI
ncbi:hypothetical protein CEY02_04430 [Bacillus pumilus]|uniref:Uncharacterized protein n=1 Tax=Bacillus pumilus TaxID=1408 RepID=A0A2A5IYJ1_BACPU|nr:hypothetical protein CEY02_04430 [Bacillus pumilus]